MGKSAANSTIFMEAIYAYPDDQKICVELVWIFHQVRIEVHNRIVFTGSATKGTLSNRDAGYVASIREHVCFTAPASTSLSLIRVTLLKFPYLPFADLEFYEWAFKPDTNE